MIWSVRRTENVYKHIVQTSKKWYFSLCRLLLLKKYSVVESRTLCRLPTKTVSLSCNTVKSQG